MQSFAIFNEVMVLFAIYKRSMALSEQLLKDFDYSLIFLVHYCFATINSDWSLTSL